MAHRKEFFERYNGIVPMDLLMKNAKLAVVLGSGLSDLTVKGDLLKSISYSGIKGLKGLNTLGVKGHVPRADLVDCGGSRVLIFRGRIHGYESAGVNASLEIVKFIHSLGIKNILFTHAVGSLRKGLKAGQMVLTKDHINLTGTNPFLSGALKAGDLDPFKDLSNIYNNDLSRTFKRICRKEGISVKDGVYAGVRGPLYETGAEAAFFRRIGADVAGMSLVQEALTAFFLGINVLSASYITNSIFGGEKLSHDIVLRKARAVRGSIAKIVPLLVKRI